MNENISFSIVVPAFNVERYIAKCLDSLMSQSESPLEVIVVNDASTDATLALINEFESRSDLIRCISLQKNVGLGEARNIGLRQSRGDYVVFVDSDDWVEPTLVSSLSRSIKSSPKVDVVLFGYTRFYEKSNRFITSDKNNVPMGLGDVSAKNCLDFGLYAWNKAYRRVFLIDENLSFDWGYYEDIVWNYLVYSVANRVEIVRRSLYFYRFRDNSILNSSSDRHIVLFERYRRLLELLLAGRVKPEFGLVLIKRMMAHVVGLWLQNSARVPRSSRFQFFEESVSLFSEYKIESLNSAFIAFSEWPIEQRIFAMVTSWAILRRRYRVVATISFAWPILDRIFVYIKRITGGGR